jgi:tetratricopeptide (TPR) repeat protein
MRGTTSRADYNEFVKAVAGFPPTERDGKSAQVVFVESYAVLDKLAGKFPRAMAWKAYALALSVSEAWPLPPSALEAGMNAKDQLDEALRLAQRAVNDDDTDYDLHWALADVYVIRGEFAKAIEAFEEALYLNRDERHPSLFAEAASAMMQEGSDFDNADAHFRKAKTPDWHHWSRGIFLFLKARRGDPDTFLNLALEELKETRTQPGDDFYQAEIHLVLALVHWRRSELFTQKEAAATNQPAKDLFNQYAARNSRAARRAINTFKNLFPHWTAKTARDSLALGNKDDKLWWDEAVDEVWKL